jgi:uncharacterized BrkB/YihY/UPF0761 family membrane protein
MARDLITKLKSIISEDFAANGLAVGATGAVKLSRPARFVHFIVFTAQSFVRNRCPVKASALAYSNLLALVPMLAIAIIVSASILKKEGEKPIEQFVGWVVSNITPAPTGVAQKPDGGKAD